MSLATCRSTAPACLTSKLLVMRTAVCAVRPRHRLPCRRCQPGPPVPAPHIQRAARPRMRQRIACSLDSISAHAYPTFSWILASQSRRLGGTEQAPATRTQSRRQPHWSVAQPGQPADLEAHRLPQPPHLAVAALAQHHTKPAVRAGRSADRLPSVGSARCARSAPARPRAVTPVRSCASAGAVGLPRTRTRYSRSISLTGCIRRCASAPSVVNSSRPVVLTSSRPITTQRPLRGAGSRSNTVGRPCGSDARGHFAHRACGTAAPRAPAAAASAAPAACRPGGSRPRQSARSPSVRNAAVHGEPPGADPLLDLPPRAVAGRSQQFLQPLANLLSAHTCAPDLTAPAARSCGTARPAPRRRAPRWRGRPGDASDAARTVG